MRRVWYALVDRRPIGGDTPRMINEQSLVPSNISLVPDTFYVGTSASFKLDAVKYFILFD